MKKILIFLLILFIFTAAALGVFIATFDINRYKPFIVQKIEENTGMPVGLGRLSLSWGSGGLGISARDLAVYTSAEKKSKSVKAGEVFVRLEPLPLLKKEVRIHSVVLTKPVIVLEKTREGRVRLLGAKLAVKPAKPPQAGAGVSPPLSVQTIRVADGELHLYDDSAKTPLHLAVRDLDLEVRDFSLSKVFSFSLRSALFSRAQNVSANGRLRLPQQGEAVSAEDLSLETDLKSLDLAEFSEAFPAFQKLQFDGQPAGRLYIRIKQAQASHRLEGGRLAFQIKPDPALRSPQLGGHLSLELDAEAQGLTPEAIRRSVSGRGRLRLKDGVIFNFNLLREVFQKISLFPGLGDTLGGAAAAPYTALGPVDLSFVIRQGVVDFGNVVLTTELFVVQGPCQVGLDGSVQARLLLRVHPRLASNVLQLAGRMQSLLNANGELEIPVTLSGKWPRIAAVPDPGFLASKLVASFLP